MTARLAAALAPALAAGAGLALLVSHPPVRWWWASFLVVPLLLAALHVDARAAEADDRGVRAFRLGGLAGLAVFLPMLSWLILPAGYIGWVLLAVVQASWFGSSRCSSGRCSPTRCCPSVRRWRGRAWSPGGPSSRSTGSSGERSTTPTPTGTWLLPVARLVGSVASRSW
jgi:apolipoprotein N-acyltransferase